MKSVFVLAGRPAPRPSSFFRACRSCAGWDGGAEPSGLCLYHGRPTGRDTQACNDFELDPSMKGQT